MADDDGLRYYAAVLASGLSVLGWIVFARLEQRLYQVEEEHWLF